MSEQTSSKIAENVTRCPCCSRLFNSRSLTLDQLRKHITRCANSSTTDDHSVVIDVDRSYVCDDPICRRFIIRQVPRAAYNLLCCQFPGEFSVLQFLHAMRLANICRAVGTRVRWFKRQVSTSSRLSSFATFVTCIYSKHEYRYVNMCTGEKHQMTTISATRSDHNTHDCNQPDAPDNPLQLEPLIAVCNNRTKSQEDNYPPDRGMAENFVISVLLDPSPVFSARFDSQSFLIRIFDCILPWVQHIPHYSGNNRKSQLWYSNKSLARVGQYLNFHWA